VRWDVDAGLLKPVVMGDSLRRAAFASHGTRAATFWTNSPSGMNVTDRRVGVWNLESKKLEVEYPVGTKVDKLSISEDGRIVAAVGGDRVLRIWKAAAPAPPAGLLKTAGAERPVNIVKYLADGQSAVVGDDGNASTWTPEPSNVLFGRKTAMPASRVAVNRLGDLFAYGTGEASSDVPRVALRHVARNVNEWNNAFDYGDDGDIRTYAGHTGRIVGLNFLDGDRKLLTVTSDGAIRTFDVQSEQEQSKLETGLALTDAVLLRDGRVAAIGPDDPFVHFVDPASGERSQSATSSSPALLCLGVAGSSQRIAAGGADGRVSVWSVPDGSLLSELTGHRRPVRSVDLNHDGSQALTGSDDFSVRLWDVDS
jgi:WD40 repeat protein